MKIYVATSFADKDRAEQVSQQIFESGPHFTTCDWWNSKEPSVFEALRDVQGILDCDVMVVLVDKPFIFKGTIFEMGIAYAHLKTIIIVGNELDSMVFTLLPGMAKRQTVEEAIALLQDIQEQQN